MARTLDECVRRAQDIYLSEITAHVRMKECIDKGWTLVDLDPWKLKSLKPIEAWISEYCKHPTHRSGNNLLFESQEEAIWFKLRWL